jgi:subtilisin family serine protease
MDDIQFLPIEDMQFESVVSVLSEAEDWGQIFTGVPDAHQHTKGAGITVAVLDTGCPDHIDLNDNILPGFCTTGEADIMDHQGHSSHVSGIIAAIENGMGVIGVAPQAKVLPIKILGDNGLGNYDSIGKAIQKATEMKVDIINMSFGSPFEPPLFIHEAIKAAYDKGIIMVAAAGNDGHNVNYPAKYDEIIAVAAIDKNGNLANFSSRGPEVEVSAPGVAVYSTYLNNQYAVLNGTSQASPLIVGICALLLSWTRDNPGTFQITNTQDMMKALDILCDPSGRVAGKESDMGYGIPQCANFMPWKDQLIAEVRTSELGQLNEKIQ